MELNQYIDHTLLKATATKDDIIKLCNEAKEYNFYAVCVNSCYISLVKNELKNSDVKIAVVVGFPLGANSANSKLFEAEQGVKKGADEIDMVLNLGFLKSEMFDAVEKEISDIKQAIGGKILKVILETCYLSNSEIITACKISKAAGADFVKTSTGFGTGGATEEAVKLMVETVGDTLKVKASGGIRDAKTAKKYIDLGVSRIGTSSGIRIVTSSNTSTNEHTY
ncbi:deoxyribose-phosphate aldolase [Aequorivita xiaoshiensis]|uniref:Deoxyribose-phosphate aldolase n=1 Tax=Aequorivita xiaoshiensis TaxID=2874476 RepID=A0A9X1R4R1_9FLAO|nr:deoxyribose-phosphate aldolase [Aequorivita xiaoshiensis]MCG2431897.1 deoxyribose-phosphate aldolase [Aequorivita xiaoshiensis]